MIVTQKRSSDRVDQRRRLSNMCYRVLCWILVSSLTVMALTSHASAASSNRSTYNLLTAPNYYYKYGSIDWVKTDSPSCYVAGASMVLLTWYATEHSQSFDYIYFNIRCDVQPTVFRFSETDSGTTRYADLVGSYDGLYQYRIAADTFRFGDMYLRIHFGSAFSGNILVESCYGVSQDFSPIAQVNAYSYYRYIDRSSSDNVQIVQQLDKSWSEAYLPIEYYIGREGYDITGIDWSHELVYVDVPHDYLSFDSVGKITFLVASVDIIDVNITLYNKSSDTVTDVVPCTVESSVSFSTVPGLDVSEQHNWPVVIFEITADLSEYELQGKTIDLSFFVTPFESDTGYDFVYWSLIGGFAEPYNPDIPWYETMWIWIKGGFNDVITTLQNLFGDSSGGSLGQAGAEMSDQAQQMNDAMDSVNSYEHPELDSAGLFNDYKNFDSGGLRILSALTSNEYTTSLMVVVFTFSLAGYVFFGKKG